MAKYPFEYKQVQSLEPEELFAVLDDWINCHSWVDTDKINDELNRTHRTLQQAFIGMFFKILVKYGQDHKDKRFSDGRNEAAVLLCNKLAEMVEKEQLPSRLPYV